MANELADVSLSPSQPLAQQDAPAAPTPADSAPPEVPTLPAPLDQVAAGQIPAVTLEAFDDKNPVHEFVVSNFDKLSDLGLDYAELGGKDHLSVVYNPSKISEPDLQAAYKAGKIEQIAPIATGKAAAATVAPTAAAEAAPAVAASSAPAGPLASVQAPVPSSSMQRARAKNLTAIVAQPQNKPTGGPVTANSRRAF